MADHIEYDEYAISEEGSKNQELAITCRNLYGGLIEGKCVCAGYADILRNVCECVGIEAQSVVAFPDIDNGVEVNIKDPTGHAWNNVKLDGEWYCTDLTWDRNNVVLEKFPLKYFLKSTKDFFHNDYSNTRKYDVKCNKSITESEQIALFTGREVSKETLEILTSDKNKSLNYLSNSVIATAIAGLNASQFRAVHNGLCIVNNKKEIYNDNTR